MKNITEQFNSKFEPCKALLIYRFDKEEQFNQFQRTEWDTQIYVESYDIGKHGKPVNAHPFSVKEMVQLYQLMQATQDVRNIYLKSKGLIPANVLYVDQQSNGYVVWYTPPREVDLFFVDGLAIPSGRFKIPALVWKANAERLSVYGVKGKSKPAINTKLCHAPFLNIYGNGQVCMGTVQINIDKTTCLEEFITTWEQYFLESNFSHSISGNNSTKTNTTELWRSLAGTGQEFPQKELLYNHLVLNSIIQ